MPTARLTADPRFPLAPVDPRLFGSFVEHLGRCVYDGIYEPGHASADAHGFRQDVLELVRELGVTTIRYPGGNFVSGYRWEDGVGPREQRPRRLDLAWHSTETNEVGLDEFAAWAERAGTELMLAVNLGTRGVQEAIDLLEYTNAPAGSAIADQRVANGRTEPYGVRMWCLGNEMDGPWQLGHRSAEEYGALAARTAKGMRMLDPRVQLVACGSSAASMPTFGEWERVVLEHAFDDVDFISCHAYYQEKDGDLASFLASGVGMDRFIDSVVATADQVAARRHSAKRIAISFDEWNVWYLDQFEQQEKLSDIEHWPVAPRLLENRYSAADAVVVGGLLISLLRHADRVHAASLAQLVNVIAPIMTEPGGPAWRQTTFFPFAVTARAARDAVVLQTRIEAPATETAEYGSVPLVDAVATVPAEGGGLDVFAVHRGLTEPVTLELPLGAFPGLTAVTARSLHEADPYAGNSLTEPERVGLRANSSARIEDGVLRVELPPVSWTAVQLR